MLASAWKFLSDTINTIQNEVLGSSVRTATTSGASSSAKSTIVPTNQTSLIQVNPEAISILKKVLVISTASAAVVGSAYYIGYQVARKRHRFHTREADKIDQVSNPHLKR